MGKQLVKPPAKEVTPSGASVSKQRPLSRFETCAVTVKLQSVECERLFVHPLAFAHFKMIYIVYIDGLKVSYFV